ncbi:MAG: hypothetical protein AAF891_05405, partial [Pseudomonadota bacterium]
MTRFSYSSALMILMLAGCNSGTNPFIDNANAAAEAQAQTQADGSTTPTTTNTNTDTDTTSDTGAPISSNRTLLPGTVSPTSGDQIFRKEARSDTAGDGFAENFRYDGNTDTFFVDNLAFDGEGGYTVVRDSAGNRLGIGPFSVFENQAVAVDGLTTGNITQLQYRALYATGPSGNTSIAIIRTGAYIEYGFGGYIYQRNGGVVLPETGQALYNVTGNYCVLIDYKGKVCLEYVKGD